MFERKMDYEYVARREKENDLSWRSDEKYYYYYRENENYIIPTVLFCIVALFTNPPFVGICWCIIIVAGALFLCHYNNVTKLDNNPYVQMTRMKIRKTHEEMKKDMNRIVSDLYKLM